MLISTILISIKTLEGKTFVFKKKILCECVCVCVCERSLCKKIEARRRNPEVGQD